MCKHSVIHTGGNIYNDYIDEIDHTGRVLIVSEGGIRLFASDRDYQCDCNPIVWASSPQSQYDAKCPDCGEWCDYDDIGTVCGVCRRGVIQAGDFEPCQENSQIADLESTTDYVFIRDIEGATLTVYREKE